MFTDLHHAKQLVCYLEQHSIEVISYDADFIKVIEIYCLEGKSYEQAVTLKATKQAIRDWLGY